MIRIVPLFFLISLSGAASAAVFEPNDHPVQRPVVQGGVLTIPTGGWGLVRR
ncbi:hypothetical protein LCM17_03420 [Cereibacter sphaeroides]|nr:hypothetical protein [Cereibacter sphaeroides]